MKFCWYQSLFIKSNISEKMKYDLNVIKFTEFEMSFNELY